MVFYQKTIESGLSTLVTNKVSGVLHCTNTNTEIPPVQWTDRIESFF